MRRRCFSVSCKDYPDYGGRGIGICHEWGDFWKFIEDMGDKPSSIHSIDRINNDKGYSKDNCKWSTPVEQANNRRRGGRAGGMGVSYDKGTGKYVAGIYTSGKITKKRFVDFFEACCFRKSLENKLLRKGFTGMQ